MKIPWKPGQSILFVCYGNTCRSPMAEGLTKKLLGAEARVESAGLAPGFVGAQDEAIDTLQEKFAIDISVHRARSVSGLDLDQYDWIIAMDPYVFNQLKIRLPKDSRGLLLWDIKDPFGQEKKAYAACAETILRHIQKYFL